MNDGTLWYTSKTFWGGLLLGGYLGLETFSRTGDLTLSLMAGVGSWLGLFGLRDAIAKITPNE